MNKISELRNILTKSFPWNKARLTCFTQMLVALFSIRSVNLEKLATAMQGRAQISSNYRRLQRFFAEVTLDYDLIARWIFSYFIPAGEKVYLTIDRTNWCFGKQPINVMMLAIAYEGIAIPLFWKVLPKDGTSNTPERIALVERFIQCVGTTCIAGLLADREFIGKTWFQWLSDQKIPFCIRLKENFTVRVFNGKGRAVAYLFRDLQAKTQKTYENYVKIFGITLRVSAGKNEKGELLIIASNVFTTTAVSVYLRRWEIECLFGALKTHGFYFEETHLTYPDRIEKLLALLAVGFSWAHKVGEWHVTQQPMIYKKHPDGTLRPQHSFFRRGLDCICHILLNFQQKYSVFREIIRNIKRCAYPSQERTV